MILKNVNAKYVYGLTATPTRKDGHHPIIFMQCGPIRYRDDAKNQAEKRPFEHYIIPRFTSLRIHKLSEKEEKNVDIIFTPNIHQKFAIIDQKIIWYGSINLLSYGNAEESIMRIESPKIAYDLIESMERKSSGINSGRK
jgi:superfamily II DNA or RNA helicase